MTERTGYNEERRRELIRQKLRGYIPSGTQLSEISKQVSPEMWRRVERIVHLAQRDAELNAYNIGSYATTAAIFNAIFSPHLRNEQGDDSVVDPRGET